MSLSKEQYDRIMLEYSQTRDKHQHALDQRRQEVYAKIPAYRDLENTVPDLLQQQLRMVLSGAQQTTGAASAGHEPAAETAPEPVIPSSALRQKIQSISHQKKVLLHQAGFPDDYLELHYTCPDCKDTGYIGQEKCHCLKAKEISVLYDQSHLRELTRRDNFRNLSDAWYQGDDLTRFHKALATAQNFIHNFQKDYENLYFYGTVGTGKSFLSICIAEQILNQGNSVLYFSASALFDQISSYIFGNRSRDEYRSFCDDLYGCDLLIIDDLGTEMTNSFVSTQLFTCLNERHLNQKSTIISSNLSLEEMRGRYSDRIFSRITSNYQICKLTGPDIRILKKVQGRKSDS